MFGITITLPKPQTSSAKADGRFGKQDFVYLPEEDAYRCPGWGAIAISLHERGGRQADKTLLDHSLSKLFDQTPMHDGT